MSHTKEPWAAYKDGKPSANNETIFIKSLAGDLVTYGHLSHLSYDDARRIVACVTACAGISTDHLEKHGLPGFAEKISALVEQRHELLAVLQSMFNEHGEFEYELGTLIKASAAIAKAKVTP